MTDHLAALTQEQKSQLRGFINDVQRNSPRSAFGELDDAYIAAGSRPLPEPLETLAKELKPDNEQVRTDIGTAIHDLFGIPGMKVVLFRACHGDRGLYYRICGAFNGIGGWQN